jgi:hypothetical protein
LFFSLRKFRDCGSTSLTFAVVYFVIVVVIVIVSVSTTQCWFLAVLFSLLIQYTVGSTPWMGDQHVARPLDIHRTTQTQNERTKTSMLHVGFEPTGLEFERAKTVHASDRAAAVTDT